MSISGQNCIFKKEIISPEKWKSGRSEEKVQEFKSILVVRKDKWKANGKLGNTEDDVEYVGMMMLMMMMPNIRLDSEILDS